MSELTASSSFVAASLAPRDVLRSTWALFQLSALSCLPLALVGVTASGVPGAEAAVSGASRGFAHDPQWWALYVASAALMLICYGAVGLRQLSLADGAGLAVFDALRRSALTLPATAGTAVLTTLAIALGCVLLVLPGLVAAVWLSLAWPAVLGEGLDPLAAIRRSVGLVRGRFVALAVLLAVILAAVLVFVVLSGIFFGVIMAVAGQRGPETVAGLSLSRLLFGAVLALPVVYVSAAFVVIWRTRLAATTR